MINGLDLFTGIGGLSVALREWVKPVAYCEIDTYCQAVLLNNNDRFYIPRRPIWDDVRTLQAESFDIGLIDIIYGGFPCQDISVAGRGKGLEAERSGLFFEILRLAKEIKPKFIFLENVPAITSRGGLRVVREITEMGYDCRWCVISAASVGALHKRERWFLLAHTTSLRCDKGAGQGVCPEREAKQHEEPGDTGSEVLNYWKNTEPPVCGVANGVPNRMDRIRALGNAVVISQAKEAFKILMGYK